jgi:hypothetical protein
MSETQVTPFGNRVAILADLWMGHRFDEDFQDFVEYNDLGLPLAYALDNKIIDESPMCISFINETWDLFIEGLGLEDTGFDSLNDVLESQD